MRAANTSSPVIVVFIVQRATTVIMLFVFIFICEHVYIFHLNDNNHFNLFALDNYRRNKSGFRERIIVLLTFQRARSNATTTELSPSSSSSSSLKLKMPLLSLMMVVGKQCDRTSSGAVWSMAANQVPTCDNMVLIIPP